MKSRIKQVRKNNHLTMEQFGARIGITKSSVSLLESGKNSPSEQTIKLICKEFNINKEWLLTGNGEMDCINNVVWGDICADIAINDPKAREAIMKYYELSEEDKKLWWNWVEKFLK